MRKVAIVGLGLMGGSLGLALKARGAARVAAYARREETRRQALELGAADEAWDDPARAVRGAEIVAVCVPVLATRPLLESFRDALEPGAVVTDVGSAKAQVAAEADAALNTSPAVFVGSHPIAGSEQTGVAAARADLYDGAVVVVTPGTLREDSEPVRRVCALWESVGARVRMMEAGMHDRLLARTSHLPHLAAAALVDVVLGGGSDGTRELCGSGFRDATRVAGGDEGLWHDIVRSNSAAIAAELDAYERALKELRGEIESGRFEAVREFLARARRLRAAE